jgi:hypothetical protein
MFLYEDPHKPKYFLYVLIWFKTQRSDHFARLSKYFFM